MRLTETGRFHIDQLQLNRPPLVAHCRARRRQVELTQAGEELLSRQEELRQRVVALERALGEAERRLASE